MGVSQAVMDGFVEHYIMKGKTMELDLRTKFKSVQSGDVLKDGEEELTLGLVCSNALLIADAKTTKADDKVKKFNMAVKFADKDLTTVTAEDIVVLKKCINVAYEQPLIVGQAFAMLDACGHVPDPDNKDTEPLTVKN